MSSHGQQCCIVCITKMWLGPRVAFWWKLKAATALRRVRGVSHWHAAFLNTRVCVLGHSSDFPEATSATIYAFLMTCIPLPSVFLLRFCADLSWRSVWTCCCSPWPASARGSAGSCLRPPPSVLSRRAALRRARGVSPFPGSVETPQKHSLWCSSPDGSGRQLEDLTEPTISHQSLQRSNENYQQQKKGEGGFIFSVFPLLLYTSHRWGAESSQPHVPLLVCQYLAQLSLPGSLQPTCRLLNCNQDAVSAIARALCSPVWPVWFIRLFWTLREYQIYPELIWQLERGACL